MPERAVERSAATASVRRGEPREGSRAELRGLPATAVAAPEVHIHIGRVELTALTAPAEPRRKPARTAAATMSLDDYLRGRRERAS